MRHLVLVTSLILVCACAPPSDGPQTLRFWAMGREGEVVAQLLPEFERRNPDIRIRLQQIPWTAAHEKLLTAFAGDALPDLCQLGNTWVPELVALRALASLDFEVEQSSIIKADDYFPGLWDTNVIDGHVYGIPWYVDTRLLFYRTDLLAQAGFDGPPRSWKEWEQMLGAVKRSGDRDRSSILLPLTEFEPLLALALQQEAPLLRDDGSRGAFASPGFRRALTYYADMFRHGWAPELGGSQISNVWTEFGRGRYAFYISGPWNIEELKRRLPADQQDRWMTAPLPGPDGPGISIAGGSSLVIFRSSKRQQAAWRLIEYLSEPAVQIRFHELTGNLPPRRTAWQDPRLTGDIHSKAFREQLERVRPAPKVPEWERIAHEMQMTAERVVRRGEDVDRATAALDARVDAILEKRRWMLSRGASR